MSNTVIYGLYRHKDVSSVYYIYLGSIGYGFDLTGNYACVTFSIFDGHSTKWEIQIL